MMMSKEQAILLSVFLLFKFLSKDLIIPAFLACFIHGIDALFVTLPPIKCFLTKECNYEEAVSRTPPIRAVLVDFVKSWVLASIPGFFFCMWYAAKKYCLANNVLGISSRIQGIEMLSLGQLKTRTILLFPIADAVWRSSLLTTGDTVIPGIFVALALPIAVPGCRMNRFFDCAFFRYAVGLTLIIIINWFQAAQRGQPALQYVSSGVIGFVAVHCLWNREVKRDDTNQLMCKVWDWNMYGAKLKKFDGWVLQTGNKDDERGEDDVTAVLEDCGDGPEDGGSGPENGNSGPDNHDSGPENGNSGLDNHDSGLDDSRMASKDSDDEPRQRVRIGQRAVQVLAISANFPIFEINGYDGCHGRCIYVQREGEVQEEGTADLVPIGPRSIIMADGYFSLEVYADESGPPIIEDWVVSEDYEIEEYTRTICAGPGRRLEITYLVIPLAFEANVEVKLKLKDLGSTSRAVYGKIKASATDYRNKSVHLFSCERRTSLSFPSGATSILPLSPSMVAVPSRWELELHIEVDLTVITICDSQEEQDKNLKFSLEFTHEITSQEREVDDDQVEVNVGWYPIGT